MKEHELNAACLRLQAMLERTVDYSKVNADISALKLALNASNCPIERRQYLSAEYIRTHY